MSRTHKNTILLLAAALLVWTATAGAQTPVITNISPQPTSAGTATSIITITGQNIGGAGDKVFVPYDYEPQSIPILSRSPGQLTALVPSNTFSGTLVVQVGGVNAFADFEVSFCSEDYKWPGLPVHWELNQNGAPGVPIADVAWALNVAFDTWECSSGFDHTYDGLSSLAATAEDSKNVQYWKSTPWAEPEMVALATAWVDTATKVISECDIAYNSANFAWSIGGSPTTMDIQSIATHESGHFLGLLDIYGSESEKTMYYERGFDDTSIRSLHPHDVLGAEYLYPHGGRGNLTWYAPSGWEGPVMPREYADATPTWAPLSSSLPGYATTYVNVNERNTGFDCLAPVTAHKLSVDGEYWRLVGWEGRSSMGADYPWINMAATIPGGRHTIRVDYDLWNEVVESNENDNTFEIQFAWTPFGLADQHPEVRPAPPEQGLMSSRNCEGFMFTGNWWGAVAATPSNATDDYDILLFDNYTNSIDSYETDLASSVYTFGRTDWVVVNGNVAGEGVTRTAGTTSYVSNSGEGVVVQQSNQVGSMYDPGSNVGDSASTGERLLVLNQNIKVHEFYLGGAGIEYEFELKNLSGGANLDLALLNPAVAYQSPSTAIGISDVGGPGSGERMWVTPSAANYFGVVVYKRGSADLPLESHYELICRVSVPNLDATDVPTGHDYAVVARNTTGATAGNVHVTPTLDGNALSTYISFSVEQEGPNDSPQWRTDLYLDDEMIEFAWSGEPVPATSVQWFDFGPYEVRGGRHSLMVIADGPDELTEPIESDNVVLQQYVWSPLVCGLAVPVTRDAPPAIGVLPYQNCDGLTFTRDPGYAWVAGLAPFDQGDDYDLYVYDSYLGATSGFDTYMGASEELWGQADFVVGHFYNTPEVILAGAANYKIGSDDMFTFQANDANGRQGGLTGTFLYQGMGPMHVVDVYEAYLSAGQRVLFKLENLIPSSDLKIHVFPGSDGGIYGKTDPHEISTTFVPGEEWLVFEASVEGWHPIVVSREDYRGLEEYVEYNLTWGPTEISGVDDPVRSPTKLMFMAPAPNPTSGETALAFALPGEGRVNIDVFDVRGHRVMTLADRQYPAGRHEVRWTGRDDQGRLAATGVYYARLRFAGQTLTRRMTVLR